MNLFKFTQLTISTITISAQFDNIQCHEKTLPSLCTANDRVVRIASNYGDVIYPGYTLPPVVVKSNRGRKKNKVKKQRQIQGSGKFMNSQTTFYVIHSGGVYKIKVFRTGKIQIPGIKTDDFTDIVRALGETQSVLSTALGLSNDGCPLHTYEDGRQIQIVMKNYQWAIDNPKWIINLELLKNKLREKHDTFTGIVLDKHDISFDPESYQGLLFKIRLTDERENSTFKVFKSGKINITIKNNVDNIHQFKSWFLDFLQTSECVYDTTIESSDESN
jgi:TATA-box binding protein (TBP) (component of TFIID and TFIIIB)